MSRVRLLILSVFYNLVNVPILAAWLFKAATNPGERVMQAALIIGSHACFVVAVNVGLKAQKRFGPVLALVHTLIETAVCVYYFTAPQLARVWTEKRARPEDPELAGKIVEATIFSLPLLVLVSIAILAAFATQRTPSPKQ